MNKKKELIHEVLKDNFYEEVDIIGHRTLDQCLDSYFKDGEIVIFESDHGSNLELTEIINLIGLIIKISDFAIKIIDKYRKEKKEISQKNTEEVIDEIIENLDDLEKYKLQKEERRIKRLVKDIISND